jgi:hypothetical protein
MKVNGELGRLMERTGGSMKVDGELGRLERTGGSMKLNGELGCLMERTGGSMKGSSSEEGPMTIWLWNVKFNCGCCTHESPYVVCCTNFM